MLTVMEGARLEVPPAAKLPGGGFADLPKYVALMRRCWAQKPADRPPSFVDVLAGLRALKA